MILQSAPFCGDARSKQTKNFHENFLFSLDFKKIRLKETTVTELTLCQYPDRKVILQVNVFTQNVSETVKNFNISCHKMEIDGSRCIVSSI